MKKNLVKTCSLILSIYNVNIVAVKLKPHQKNTGSLSHVNNRISSFPYVSGDSFRAIADHIIDDTNKDIDPSNVKAGDVIFLKTDFLAYFFNNIHPKVNNKYILITHNSDYPAPGEFEQFLNDEKIIFWFGMNPSIKNHPKFEAIPIGIANFMWGHGNISQFNSFFTRKISFQKEYLLGINFVINTNYNEREKAFDFFKDKPYCQLVYSQPHSEYLRKMSLCKFIISPPGNSVDCHRTWEALLTGAIPIVLRSNLDKLFEDLPVLVVSSWDEVTEDFLSKKYEEFEIQGFVYDKIFLFYWIKKIERYKKML